MTYFFRSSANRYVNLANATKIIVRRLDQEGNRIALEVLVELIGGDAVTIRGDQALRLEKLLSFRRPGGGL